MVCVVVCLVVCVCVVEIGLCGSVGVMFVIELKLNVFGMLFGGLVL